MTRVRVVPENKCSWSREIVRPLKHLTGDNNRTVSVTLQNHRNVILAVFRHQFIDVKLRTKK
jgi:hypothetical protein